jgi:hypothetical protein
MDHDHLTDTKQGQSNKDTAEVTTDAERSQPENQSPLPGLHPTARTVVQESVDHYLEAGETISQGADTEPELPGLIDTQDEPAIEKSSDYYRGSSELSESSFNSSEQSRNLSLESLAEAAFARVNDHLGQSNPSDVLHTNFTGGDEAELHNSRSREPSDTNSRPKPYTISPTAGPRAVVQEPNIRQRVSDLLDTPISLLRAKAGHYMTHSPLVSTDADDMNGETDVKRANRMVGNREDRGKKLVGHDYFPKSKPLGGHSSNINPFKPTTVQDGATSSLLTSDASKKRNFGEFDVDTASAPSLHSGRQSALIDQNEPSMSPRARREEHARKRQAKQQALAKARDEAEALRRQVAEIEAGQADAIAHERAEVS